MKPIKPIIISFFSVLLLCSVSYAQSLPHVVDQVNGAMNTTVDSVKSILKLENKKLIEESYGEWLLYDRFGTYTFITDVNNEYIVEVFFVPYQEDWFEKQDYSRYALTVEDLGGEVSEWADDIQMYKDDETGVWFGDVTTMEGERRIAIWSHN